MQPFRRALCNTRTACIACQELTQPGTPDLRSAPWQAHPGGHTRPTYPHFDLLRNNLHQARSHMSVADGRLPERARPSPIRPSSIVVKRQAASARSSHPQGCLQVRLQLLTTLFRERASASHISSCNKNHTPPGSPLPDTSLVVVRHHTAAHRCDTSLNSSRGCSKMQAPLPHTSLRSDNKTCESQVGVNDENVVGVALGGRLGWPVRCEAPLPVNAELDRIAAWPQRHIRLEPAQCAGLSARLWWSSCVMRPQARKITAGASTTACKIC